MSLHPKPRKPGNESDQLVDQVTYQLKNLRALVAQKKLDDYAKKFFAQHPKRRKGAFR